MRIEHNGIQYHGSPGYTVTGERSESALDLLDIIERGKPAWMKNRHRHCAGMDPAEFFGSDSAAQICDGCPVRDPCLNYAIDNGEYGVWGGTSERLRRRIRRVMT